MGGATFKIIGDDERQVDATFAIEGAEIVFHARGGSKSSGTAVNTEYGVGLRLLLRRLAEAGLEIEEVLVDSSVVRSLPDVERRVLSGQESALSLEQQYTLITSRMKDIGRDPGARAGGGNSTKRIRIRIHGRAEPSRLVSELRGVTNAISGRLSATDLHRVRPRHVWSAVQQLAEDEGLTDYGEFTKLDLVTDEGKRLVPEQVFGLAASEALGFRVLPEHLSNSEAPLFTEILRSAGFRVVPKGSNDVVEPNVLPVSPEEKEWAEGNPQLVMHLTKERNRSLVRAKRDSFIAEHGQLFCEACGLQPDQVYGESLGSACIEVHHVIAVADMDLGHRTRLDDLQCLCANCHRVEHRRLRGK